METVSPETRNNELPPIPPRPESRYEMNKYYEENKAAILQYVEKLGEKEACLRWGISQATWLCRRIGSRGPDGLAVRWGLATKVSEKPPPVKKVTGTRADTITIPGIQEIPSPNKGLPIFPPWNDNWSDEVKITWLQVYRDLAGKGAGL